MRHPLPVRAPWDYSKAPAEGEGFPNERDEAGIALGAELARLCDVEEEAQRKQFPYQLPRCDDCAFRKGTLPNGCSETLMDAIKCVVELNPFYCHKGLDDGKPKHICRGWWLMIATKEPEK